MKSTQSKNFLRARRRVDQQKRFYKHLRIYIFVNIFLLVVKFKAIEFFTEQGIQDQGFFDWFEWNMIGTPIVWGIGLALHAFYVFKLKSKPWKELTPKFFREWEDRQLKRFMEEEHHNANRFE